MSWKLEAKENRLDPRVVSAIIQLFNSSNETELRFKEIHAGLVLAKLTSTSNYRKTTLYLRRLTENGILRKSEKTNRYSLKIQARDYETFAYLSWMNEQYGIRGLAQSFSVRGMTWSESRGVLVPFVGQPTKLDEFLLGELETQLSTTFDALRDLRNKILLGDSGFDAGYTQAIMRQGLLAMATNILDRADITNLDLYRCLEELCRGSKDVTHNNQEITMKYVKEGVRRALALWKKLFYDVHGESSDESYEDMWLPMLTRHGEGRETLHATLESRKDDLKRDGFDVDRWSLSEIKKKKTEFDASIEKKIPPLTVSLGSSSYIPSPNEQMEESNLDEAYGIKWAEIFLQKGVDWEDFAVMITTPPEVMSKYNTTLHELKDQVTIWKTLCPIDNELLRFFASELLTYDLSDLRQPGIASMVGLADDQLDRLIQYWNDLRREWRDESKKENHGDVLFYDSRPRVELSQAKTDLMFSDLKRKLKRED